MPDESRLLPSGILYCTVQRVTIPDAVIIQFVFLKMGMLMLEICHSYALVQEDGTDTRFRNVDSLNSDAGVTPKRIYSRCRGL
jgi:hypothetical protein